MARKRNKLRKIDYNSLEYWNALLVQEGLGTDTGRDPRLIPVGNFYELGILERLNYTSGRKLPHKQAE
jgi:hypothetical protein